MMCMRDHGRKWMAVVLTAVGLQGPTIAATDPLFDMETIMAEPVAYEMLESEVVEGIVFETFEFTSRVVAGEPERIRGIFAYPEGGRDLPAVYWCQGGMAPAGRLFPGIFARKGYACLAITLPTNLRNAHRGAFDATDPRNANLTLLARDQLRGITVLSQRSQIDPERMAVAGASYGGMFATLIAGVDPRVKAGFSFFAGGHHAMGTNLPQFHHMNSLDDVAVWNRTIDGAFRLKERAIPFLWGVAFNDNWFYFPAVAQTFKDAAGDGKRIAILPHWEHGFPPHIDQALIDFLDTTLTKKRPFYNAPGALKVSVSEGITVAEFSWTGENPVLKAEVVASYGEPSGWLGWRGRAAFVFPAEIEQDRARARLPIPSRDLPLVVWGSITDTKDVLTSTAPVRLTRETLATLPIDENVSLNAFIDGELGDGVLNLYRLHNQPLGGEPDPKMKHSGEQSLRFSPGQTDQGFLVRRLHHVPNKAHTLSVWVRADQPTPLTLTLTPVRPRGGDLVLELVAQDPTLRAMIPHWNDPSEPMTVTAVADADWKEIMRDVPAPKAPVDYYHLRLEPDEPTDVTWWVDTVRMQLVP